MHTRKEELAAIEMLTARSHFLTVQNNGKKWHSKTVVLQVLPNDKNIIRTGYTVTKRTQKSAVGRNRIKRRLRAAAADILSQHAKSGYDYILVGRTDTKALTYNTILSDLKWCLKKLDCYEKKNASKADHE